MCTSRPNFRGHGAPGRPAQSRESPAGSQAAIKAQQAAEGHGLEGKVSEGSPGDAEPSACKTVFSVRATQQVQVLWETLWCFLKHLSIELPHKPAIPLLGISSKEWKVRTCRDICTLMFAAALFTRAKRCRQPNWLSTAKWIKKMQYIHIMGYYSVTKRNAVLIQVTTR